MKKKFCIFLILLVQFTLSACSNLMPQRLVRDDNVFYSSSSPSIEIKVSEDFEYTEAGEENSWGYNTRGNNSTPVKEEAFFFKDKKSNSRIISIIVETLMFPRWVFSTPFYDCDDSIECGSVSLKDTDYQYALLVDQSGSQTYLVKSYARFVNAAENSRIIINYIEKVKGDWKNIKQLSDDKKARLKDFKDACDKSFKIL